MITLYWLWRLGVWLVGLAPRRLSWTIAGTMGNSLYYLMPLRRRVAEENMAHVLGTSTNAPNVRRAARLSFRNFARLLRDVMLYANMSDVEIAKRVTIHEGENMASALALGKGAIIVTAHFGNMDLASALIAKQFAPIALVSETLRPPQLMKFYTDMRGKHNVNMNPYAQAPRRIIEALKRNELTAFLIDFGVTHHLDMVTVPVNFFGAETNFPAGPAQLALLTGAPIVVGYTRVADDEKIEVHFTPPIIVQRTSDKRALFQATMQEIAHRMENFIQPTPEQWYIFRPMWHIEPAKERQIQKASLSADR